MSKDKSNTKLPLDKFVVGQFIRWRAERYMGGWDCFGVITEVNTEDETFKVRTFDTFRVTDNLSFYTDEKVSEFTLCDKQDVIDYIKYTNVGFRTTVYELELKLCSLKAELDSRETFLKELMGV